MENTSTIITIINSVGFPIASACFLAWYMVKCNARTNELLAEFREAILQLKMSIENLKENKED